MASTLRRIAVIALWTVRQIFGTAWSIIRGPLRFALQVLAALVLLFEEWGWKPLHDALALLARYAPVAALERWIASLPTYGALAVFALPVIVLFPLKLAALWLITFGHFVSATILFISAKIASTAIIARIFILTKPQLMQIDWFAAAYDKFVPWKDALFAAIRASWVWRYGRILKTRVNIQVRKAWARWQGPRSEL